MAVLDIILESLNKYWDGIVGDLRENLQIFEEIYVSLDGSLVFQCVEGHVKHWMMILEKRVW